MYRPMLICRRNFFPSHCRAFEGLPQHAFCGCHGMTQLFSKSLLLGGVVVPRRRSFMARFESNLLTRATTPPSRSNELLIRSGTPPHEEGTIRFDSTFCAKPWGLHLPARFGQQALKAAPTFAQKVQLFRWWEKADCDRNCRHQINKRYRNPH